MINKYQCTENKFSIYCFFESATTERETQTFHSLGRIRNTANTPAIIIIIVSYNKNSNNIY